MSYSGSRLRSWLKICKQIIFNFIKMINLLLVFLAILLFIVLEPISFVYVVFWKRTFKWSRITGYWRNLAVNIDRFGNYEFRSLFNACLIKSDGYKFGKFDETISSALGKNQLKGTLSNSGRILVSILDFIDKNHCEKSINWEV